MLPPLVICGLARNVEEHIQESLATIDRICAASESGHSIIVTNDNHDGTASRLHDWCLDHKQKRIIELDGLSAAIPNRIDRLAFARNAYLMEIRRLPCPPELVIVMDLDGVSAHIAGEAVEHAIMNAPTHWSGLFPSQDGPYYDLYALRHKDWVMSDVWHDVNLALGWTRAFPIRAFNQLCAGKFTEKIRQRALRDHIYNRQYFFPSNHPPVEVDSAFGGFGIYRYKSLSDSWYGSRGAKGQVVCEHVVLHSQMRKRGEHLFITSDLRTRSPAEHISGENFVDPPPSIFLKQEP